MTTITKKEFLNKDYDSNHIEASIYRLENSNGASVEITDFGGTVVSINVPDKNGNYADVCLGYDSVDQYLNNGGYFGALIGRYANRIENAEFCINQKKYKLYPNDGNNHLHGGKIGFDKRVWNSEVVKCGDSDCLKLSLFSPDGDEGYPGNFNVCVVYSLSDDNELKIEYTAECDKQTPVNLTNHSYFNLKGHNCGDITDHQAYINAEFYTKGDRYSIPTGEIVSVAGTPMSFLAMHEIGENIDDKSYDDLVFGKGYDHNYIINKKYSDKTLEKAAEVYSPDSGRVLEVYTNKPGVQFYCGNCIEPVDGKNSAKYDKRSGFCLETQFYPDSPNKPHFSNCLLSPGEVYSYTTVYKFSCR